jgi:hypothetical protein
MKAEPGPAQAPDRSGDRRRSAAELPPAPGLRELQERFLRGLRDGATADQLAAAGVFAAPPRSTATDRWHVYREGYLVRLVEAVRNDYPAVERVVGEGPFSSLAARYLNAFPPSSHDIGRAGDRLAEHLAGDPLTAELPFLPDLARFEAALAAAVVAADGVPVTREDLARIAPERLPALPLRLASGAAFIASEWPLGDLWHLQGQADEEVSLTVQGRPARLVIFRRGAAVHWRSVTAEEALFLAAAAEGTTLEALCEGGGFGAPEEAAPRVAVLLLSLLDEGIVSIEATETPRGVSRPDKEGDG